MSKCCGRTDDDDIDGPVPGGRCERSSSTAWRLATERIDVTVRDRNESGV